MNFYKHHIGDYAAATAHLSILEDGCYSRLLRIYYRDEKPLPSDLKLVQRLAGARTRDEREAVQTVLEEFFDMQADGWHSKRCDEEIARANAQADTNRRIAEEREARKKARSRHEASNESCNESYTAAGNDSLGVREPSQTPDSRLQKDQDQKRPPEAASVDPLKDAIDGGVEFLGESGVGLKQARSVIGMIRKRVGDDTAVELLAVAQREHVADPVAWLQAAARRRVSRNGSAAPSAFELAE